VLSAILQQIIRKDYAYLLEKVEFCFALFDGLVKYFLKKSSKCDVIIDSLHLGDCISFQDNLLDDIVLVILRFVERGKLFVL
jgi:hypothetical protein